MKLRRGLPAAMAVSVTLALLSARARAQSSGTITFDDLPVNTVVTTQYAAQAQNLPVTFEGNFIVAGDAANPSNQVLVNKTPGTEFNANSLTLTFLSPQNLVSLDGSFLGPVTETVTLTVTAFGANDPINPLSQQSFDVSGDSFGTLFTVTTASDLITSVVISSTSIAANIAIDNLHFEGEPAPTNNAGAPSVVITSPLNNPLTNAPTISLTGTVTGQQVYSTAMVTFTIQPQPGQPGQFSAPITLTDTGGGTFSFSGTESLPPGFIEITVTAQTVFGVQGSATVNVENVPTPVLAQCTLDPFTGMAQFDYGIPLADCSIYVCHNQTTPNQHFGLVAGSDGTLFTVSPTVLTKWQSVQEVQHLSTSGNLGCPVANTVNVGTTGSPKVPTQQAFEFGRVYEDSASNDFYVPGVFADIIKNGGDDSEVGVPTSDPTIGTVVTDVDTFWFQHFNRSLASNPADLGTTMEIRGSPPTVTVERQGGNLEDMVAVNLSPAPSTATIWERYTCSGNGPWTCTIPPRPQHNPNAGPSDAALDQICGFTTGVIPPAIDLICPAAAAYCIANQNVYPFDNGWEWAPVGLQSPSASDPANFNYKTVQGWIKPSGSFKASEDAPGAHQCWDALNPPFPSDWNIHMRPFPAYDNLQAPVNFENSLEMELENELCVMQWFFGATGGFPFPGDLVTVTGRWIADCGHQLGPNNNEFKTEIHPWELFSRAETVSLASMGFSFDANATFAPIDVNGIIVTGATVDIYPPPRPSPNAQLYSITTGQAGAYGNLIVNTTLYSDHVNMTFKAPSGFPTIEDDNGEMDNTFTRGFMGVAYVFWQ